MKRKLKAALGVTGLALGLYVAASAPVIPYFLSDARTKSGTEQDGAVEYAKSFWGSFVWFPMQRVQDAFDGDLSKRIFLVNKETQLIYTYDDTGNLESVTPTSTGKDRGIKTTFSQQVTPNGEYIAVKRWDKQGLQERLGLRKATLYGEGMLLFQGQWFPNIAIHGTTRESEAYLGEERSRGCPRVGGDFVEDVLLKSAVGSRMVVHEYGVLPLYIDSQRDLERCVSETEMQDDALARFVVNNPHIDIDDFSAADLVFCKDENGDGKIGN